MDKQAIITFLQDKLLELHPRVFGILEPSLTDRMTFFAYNQLLFRKYEIGVDLQFHARNPWKNCEPPLDFTEESQIRPIPSNLGESVQNKKKETQVISTVKVLPPAFQDLWRVFDKEKPLRTVYQGTEGQCYKYSAKANKDAGYACFDYVATDTRFVPRDKNAPKVIKNAIHSHTTTKFTPSEKGCCPVRIPSFFSPKPAKTKVQEYLARCKEMPAATEVAPTIETIPVI